MSSGKLTIHTDGGARGNPGPSGIGVVISDEKRKTVREVSEYIGKATNNQAEYRALIRGLEEVKKLGATSASIFMDSELIVKQLNGEYKVRDKGLQPLFARAWNLLQGFSSYGIKHVMRAKNKRADALVNQALDDQGGVDAKELLKRL
ncbi:MAG: ribonuclease HI family protein [Parcubacteria group bacterium]|nr:ribonuclease HI family protein [Parcubacteria group bacterium]